MLLKDFFFSAEKLIKELQNPKVFILHVLHEKMPLLGTVKNIFKNNL